MYWFEWSQLVITMIGGECAWGAGAAKWDTAELAFLSLRRTIIERNELPELKVYNDLPCEEYYNV